MILLVARGGIFCFFVFLFLFDLNFSTPFKFYQPQGVEFFVFAFFCLYLVWIFPPLLNFIMLKGWKILFLRFSVFTLFEFFHPFLILSCSTGGNFCFLIFQTFLLSKFVNIFHLFLNSLLIFVYCMDLPLFFWYDVVRYEKELRRDFIWIFYFF